MVKVTDKQLAQSIVQFDEVSYFTAYEVIEKVRKEGGTLHNLVWDSEQECWISVSRET